MKREEESLWHVVILKVATPLNLCSILKQTAL